MWDNRGGVCYLQSFVYVAAKDPEIAKAIHDLVNSDDDKYILGLKQIKKAFAHVSTRNGLRNLRKFGEAFDFIISDTNKNLQPGHTSKEVFERFLSRMYVRRPETFIPMFGIQTSITNKCNCSKRPVKEFNYFLTLYNIQQNIQRELDLYFIGNPQDIYCRNCQLTRKSKNFITCVPPKKLTINLEYPPHVDEILITQRLNLNIKIRNKFILHKSHRHSNGYYDYRYHGCTRSVYLLNEGHSTGNTLPSNTPRNPSTVQLEVSSNDEVTIEKEKVEQGCIKLKGVNQLIYTRR